MEQTTRIWAVGPMLIHEHDRPVSVEVVGYNTRPDSAQLNIDFGRGALDIYPDAETLEKLAGLFADAAKQLRASGYLQKYLRKAGQ